MMCKIGTKIKELREQKKWSQRNLALRANMSNTEIARIEKGERNNPTLDVIVKLSSAFGISVNYFLSIIGVTNPSDDLSTETKKRSFAINNSTIGNNNDIVTGFQFKVDDYKMKELDFEAMKKAFFDALPNKGIPTYSSGENIFNAVIALIKEYDKQRQQEEEKK